MRKIPFYIENLTITIRYSKFTSDNSLDQGYYGNLNMFYTNLKKKL